MVLRLYHFEKEPRTIYNVIKIAIDDNRMVMATVKEDGVIKHVSFYHNIDYQRLTIAVD